MYVTLPGITNGQSIQLLHTIDNWDGQLEVALCDVTYYQRWTNISTARGNNEIIVAYDNNRIATIPDGYYSISSLNDEYFNNEFFINLIHKGISITQNESTGAVKIINEGSDIIISENLAITLGLGWATPLPRGRTVVASINEVPDLVPYKELFIHLDQISTTDNIQLESPSTLLRSVPVKDVKHNSGRTESFSLLQYKKLKRGIISNLKISVLDVKHQPVNVGYLSVTLHIINNG